MNSPAPNPASEPRTRLRAPALWGGVMLVGCLAMFVWQTMQLLDLRREQASLRAAAASLDQLQEENAELQRLRVAAQNAERAEQAQMEVAKLRSEVAQLLKVAQELPALRAESQRLQGERAAAAARAGMVPEVDPFAEAKGRAERISCISNIKQICLAARIWENDHKELHALPVNFLTMSNELVTPRILTCSGDRARAKASTWQEFDGTSSYEILSPGADVSDPSVVYVRCLIHFNVGMTDGSAQQLNPANHRIEKVDGKWKIVRLDAQQ